MLFHYYVCVLVVLFFVVTFPAFIFFEIVGLVSKKSLRKMIQPFARGAIHVLCVLIGCRITCEGAEELPNEPMLFTANHRSYFDPVIVYHSLPADHELGFIAKIGLKKVPLLSWWMSMMGCQFINRKVPKEGLQCVQKCIAEVKDGYSIFIMPEGTRNYEEDMVEFLPGSLKVAERTNVPVVPVAIWKTDELYESNNHRFTHGKIQIRYGKPIPIAEMSREERLELPNRLRAEIDAMLVEMKANHK